MGGIGDSKIQSQIKPDEIDSSHEKLSTETHSLETEPTTLESNCSQEVKTVVSESLVSEQTSDVETNKESKSCDDHSGQSLDSENDDENESDLDQRRKARAERKKKPKSKAGGGTNKYTSAPTSKEMKTMPKAKPKP